MKLQVLQENLSKALSVASRFASPKAQLPVLGNILFSADKNKLNISSTNLEVSVSLSVGAKVEDKGEITIPSKTITDLVSNLTPGQVSIESKKEKVKITAGNFSSTVSGMNSSDFPKVPKSVGKKASRMPSGDLTDALDQVLFAASTDETRPVLTGVLVIFEKESVTLVATDGFRLSKKEIKVKKLKLKGDKETLILPKNALSEILRLSGEEDGLDFSFNKKESQATFSVANAVLSSRVIEGEFPDFEKIIPKKSDIKVNVDKEEFLRAIKLAGVFAREAANVVKLKVEEKGVEVLAESGQSGSQETTVDAKVEGGLPKKGLTIAFNYKFLEEFLNVVESEDVDIKFTDPDSPGVFVDTKDTDFLHLIMPVKI